jgi:hypothetical protein
MTSATSTPASPAPASTSKRASKFTTATVVSFSLTLFAGSLAILGGAIPMQTMSVVERIDIGAMLFTVPILALVLAVLVEATRMALNSQPLPEPRRRQVVRWSPGRREG